MGIDKGSRVVFQAALAVLRVGMRSVVDLNGFSVVVPGNAVFQALAFNLRAARLLREEKKKRGEEFRYYYSSSSAPRRAKGGGGGLKSWLSTEGLRRFKVE